MFDHYIITTEPNPCGSNTFNFRCRKVVLMSLIGEIVNSVLLTANQCDTICIFNPDCIIFFKTEHPREEVECRYIDDSTLCILRVQKVQRKSNWLTHGHCCIYWWERLNLISNGFPCSKHRELRPKTSKATLIPAKEGGKFTLSVIVTEKLIFSCIQPVAPFALATAPSLDSRERDTCVCVCACFQSGTYWLPCLISSLN